MPAKLVATTSAHLPVAQSSHIIPTMLGNAFKAVAGLAIASFAVARSSEPLPTVNLGYEVHQAALFNVSQTPSTTDLSLLKWNSPLEVSITSRI